MVTPTKQQILELAKERWRLDQIRFGNPKLAELEPEYDELLEGGYIWSAKMELMQSLESKHAKWLEKNGEIETTYEIPFNVEEALKTGFCILGNKGSGKTTLAKWLVKKLIDHGIVVYVLDSSQAWLRNSPIREHVTIQPYGKQYLHWQPKPLIFDLSLLSIRDKIRFTNLFCRTLLQGHIQGYIKDWEFIVFEEAHLIFPNGSLRGLKRYAEAVTFATVGRNYKLSFGFITQFPANVDKLLVKLTVQRYLFQTWEPNDIRYMSRLLGKHAKHLRLLSVGECLFQARGEIKKVIFEEFA
ncbi:hypothetical protein DRO19_01000 [Candidatus Bathyarchaeota archaeon]|nr:MAG: hypothetical protein DRO19_01000 [Candidatus Bathyarchaeota archaeon]